MKKIIQNKKSSWIILGVTLVYGLIVLWVCTTVEAANYSSEVYTRISTPEYVTDAGRAINAYERMMDRYMDMTSKDLMALSSNSAQMVVRMDRIEAKLDKVLQSQARIEKALGVKTVSKVKAQETKEQKRTGKQAAKKRLLND